MSTIALWERAASMLSGLEISSTRKHTRAWLRSRNLLMPEPSSTLLLQIFPLKVSHPNYIYQCSRVSPRGLVSPTSVVWVCWQTVSWHLIKSLQLISGAQTDFAYNEERGAFFDASRSQFSIEHARQRARVRV